MYCNDLLCIEFKRLANGVFNFLKKDRIIGQQTKEETISNLIVRTLKCWKYNNPHSKFSIKEFTKSQESLNGADFEWDWYFVDSSQKKWLGFRLQAKVLNLKTNRFLFLNHSNSKGHQSNLLINSSYNDSRIPFYCFYLHKVGVMSLRGCSLSSSDKVKDLLKVSNRPHVDEVLQISFPWHMIFCNHNVSGMSLPNKLLENLHTLGFDNAKLLNEQEITGISKLLTMDKDSYTAEEYYFESAPQQITIIQEKINHD